MKSLIARAAITAATAFATPAAGAVYTASANGETAFVTAFQFDGSSAEFYGHTYVSGSANTPVDLARSDAAVFFFLESATSGSGAVSVGLLLDAPRDGTPGRTELRVSGHLEGASVAASDDDGEFDGAAMRGSFTWWACCSDGVLLDGVPDAPLALSFAFEGSAGLSAVYVASPDGQGGARLTQLGKGMADIVTLGGGLSAALSQDVPVPAAFPLLAGGLAALGAARLRGRRG
ncbi:hypothetical protein ACQ5SO_18190 [Rhodovulum sp. DZ06]|uniref:hypothetical protein n=1 Tax=Rhodovulum sp. DZ06 TaxID=3425126 RepID=UPI003D3315B0